MHYPDVFLIQCVCHSLEDRSVGCDNTEAQPRHRWFPWLLQNKSPLSCVHLASCDPWIIVKLVSSQPQWELWSLQIEWIKPARINNGWCVYGRAAGCGVVCLSHVPFRSGLAVNWFHKIEADRLSETNMWLLCFPRQPGLLLWQEPAEPALRQERCDWLSSGLRARDRHCYSGSLDSLPCAVQTLFVRRRVEPR